MPFKVEESYTLAEQNIIGRSPKNEIVLNDPYISGIHARIWEAGDRLSDSEFKRLIRKQYNKVKSIADDGFY